MAASNLKHALAECDPTIGLLLSIIGRAKNDARLGNLEATAWLLTDGLRIAEMIAPDSDAPRVIVELCQDVIARIDRGRLAARWELV